MSVIDYIFLLNNLYIKAMMSEVFSVTVTTAPR